MNQKIALPGGAFLRKMQPQSELQREVGIELQDDQ
jgi:hypothetical protein